MKHSGIAMPGQLVWTGKRGQLAEFALKIDSLQTTATNDHVAKNKETKGGP